jgi:DNA polymerase III epsilon subunit-like protein
MISSAWLQQERAKATRWARDLLQTEFVILDGETTGLDADDEFVQIGVISSVGEVLLDTLIKPAKAISPGAAGIHGITAAMVADAPDFPAIFPQLRALLTHRQIVAYNVDFDARILAQTCTRYRLGEIMAPSWQCAMKQYARYHGHWNPKYRSFKWVRLTDACAIEGIPALGAHTAAGDCLLTLKLIQIMADSSED